MLAIDADAHVASAIRTGMASLGFAAGPADETRSAFRRDRELVRRLLAADAPDCDYVEVGTARLVVCVTSVAALAADAPALLDDRVYLVERDQALSRLLDELGAILAGRTRPAVASRRAALDYVLMRREQYASLTERERLVLGRLSTGASVTEVARRLGTSVHTVRAQVASILRKLDANSQQVAIARSRRFVRAEGASTFGLFGDV